MAKSDDPRPKPMTLLSVLQLCAGKPPAETAQSVVDNWRLQYPDMSPSERAELLAAATRLLDCADPLAVIKDLRALTRRLASNGNPLISLPWGGLSRDLVSKIKEHQQARGNAIRTDRASRGLRPEAGSGAAEKKINLFQVALAELQSAKDAAVLPLGHSRFGGLPDLPAELVWPKKDGKRIPFVAQINLSEFSRGAQSPLPGDGHLFIFALLDSQHRPTPVTVLFFRGPASDLLRLTTGPKDECWPDWNGKVEYRLVPLSASGRRDARAGWLYGEMERVDGTPGERATHEFADGDDWINLLAIRSVGSMQWSDEGLLYVLIRKSSLRALDFSNVIATIGSG